MQYVCISTDSSAADSKQQIFRLKISK